MESEVAQRSGQTLECPKCRIPLKVALHEDIEVDACGRCNGIWVDFVDEKKLLQIKPEVFTIDELKRLRKLYQPLGRVEKARYVPCPVCQVLMHRKNWGSHSGVIVDKCEEHGTWYDADELEKVRDFVALGGIEFEKLRLTERGLSGLENKVAQEITRLDRRVDSAYRRARLFSLIGL